MTQVTAPPTHAHCRALMRALPALTAFKRAVYAEAPHDSAGWLGTLALVSRHDDGLRPSNVADMLHVDLSVASRALSHLEELGYVRREPDPDDGRASRVHASAAGIAWIADFGDRYATRMEADLADWSDEDVVALTELLDRFGATLEATR